MMMEMVIVGTISYDDIETPSEKASSVLGGSATHSGLASSFHLRPPPGNPPRIGIVSAVGEDFSTYHQMVLEDAGMNLAGVALREGETSTRSVRFAESMDRSEVTNTELNVLKEFSPVLPKAWSGPDVLLCANSDPRIQIEVLEQCPDAKINALDTSKIWIEREFEALSRAMRMVDVVVIEEEDAKAISREKVLTQSISSIISGEALHGGVPAGPGPRSIIVKRGSSGILAHLPCGTIALPSYPTENPIDPTGRGDTFVGALFSSLIGHEASLNDAEVMRKAMVHATVTSSYCVEGIGTKGIRSLGRGKYHARADRYRRIVGI